MGASRAVVVIGVITLILGTYVNLQDATWGSVDHGGPEFIKPLPVLNEKVPIKSLNDKSVADKIDKDANDVIKNISAASDEHGKGKKVEPSSGEKRQEPAVPEAPADSKDLYLNKATKDKVEKKLEDTGMKVENKINDINE